MATKRYTPDEVAEQGEALYQRKIRDQVEASNRGKFLVLDIETGDYAIDADDLAASQSVLAQHPQAVLYGLRIGYPAAYRVGGAPEPKN